MNKIGFLFCFLLMANFAIGQRIRSLTFDQLIHETNSVRDTLLVMNFWATWCKPCIEEIPWFDKAVKDFPGKKVKMILVNLDFNSQVLSVAEPFVLKQGLQSDVWHIKNTDPNEWINRIDSSWSGGIPATVMYLNGKKVLFKEGQVKENELHEYIAKLIAK